MSEAVARKAELEPEELTPYVARAPTAEALDTAVKGSIALESSVAFAGGVVAAALGAFAHEGWRPFTIAAPLMLGLIAAVPAVFRARRAQARALKRLQDQIDQVTTAVENLDVERVREYRRGILGRAGALTSLASAAEVGHRVPRSLPSK